ncbi:MAG: polysaccharide deacetylase family protein [Thermoanaerobacteraceae bacterium]|nr:polysaccharide deacetylase family protein [Thermoanaerobacteraceae bacterium]
MKRVLLFLFSAVLASLLAACSYIPPVQNNPPISEGHPPEVIEEVKEEEEEIDLPEEEEIKESEEEEDEPPRPVETPGQDNVSAKSLSFWYQLKADRVNTAPEIGQLLAEYGGIFVGPPQKTVYLTFDLGYEAGFTPKILDTLQQQGVKAAFFVTGSFVKNQPQLVKRIASEGHLIGNHTESHPDLSQFSPSEILHELKAVDSLLAALGLPSTEFFRPPQGVFSEVVLKTAGDHGYRAVLWSFAYRDWLTDNQPEPELAKKTILAGAVPGSVLLLHAVSRSNSEVLGEVIEELKSRGYSFGSLNDL